MPAARVAQITQLGHSDPVLSRWMENVRSVLNPVLRTTTQKRVTVMTPINVGTLATATVYTSAAIPCAGALENDFVMIGPPSALPGGCVVSGFVSSPGNVKITVLNSSGGNVAPGAQTYAITTVSQ